MAGADAQGPCFCVASCVVRSRAQGGPLRLLRDLHRVGYVSELRFSQLQKHFSRGGQTCRRAELFAQGVRRVRCSDSAPGGAPWAEAVAPSVSFLCQAGLGHRDPSV